MKLNENHTPAIIQNDVYLEPYTDFINNLIAHINRQKQIIIGNSDSLYQAINGYLYYGLHIIGDSIVLREWAPFAKTIFLISEHTDWKQLNEFQFNAIGNGNWECIVPKTMLPHQTLYKLLICWDGGQGERIPAWANRVVQDNETKIFSAQAWFPKEQYKWKNPIPAAPSTPLIYEAHIGMSSEDGKVSTFAEFTKNVLPRIAQAGYNTIQLMAIQEHPYYGSFGYHVSSFFAASSRFGTPEELKELIDEAHGMGLRIIMDIVHSHAVKNEIEGISRYDGSTYQFFHEGSKGNHIAWDSKCFDYSKPDVIHFLLSNCKYWLEEFHFDGFRFDGVTSMLYFDHGLGRNFMSYDDYFNDNLDKDAVAYLALANMLIHTIRPDALTIAEDMSGFPGIASPVDYGGIGFDYRLAMGVPDYWIQLITDKKDEEWKMSEIFYRLTDKRHDEKVIAYAESHDQALVGDKTIIFRLMDAEMYYNMSLNNQSLIIDRGMALHKMIRLLTLTTAGGGYLNFMGNEFGHPEWIDFPREGNQWSYHYARRQWSLAERDDLRYKQLLAFDNAMIGIAKKYSLLNSSLELLMAHDDDQILIFKRNQCICVFNFSSEISYTDYAVYGAKGTYKIVLHTDDIQFGGFDRIDTFIEYTSQVILEQSRLQLYIPARTAMILAPVKK